MTGKLFDVVGLGYCSIDYLGIVPGRPEFDADTVSLADFAISGGGPVSTALAALARLGARTGYVGALGDDQAGRYLRRAFERDGVDLSRLRVTPGARPQTCIVLVEAGSGRRSILCHRGSPEELALDEADREYVTSARFLHLDGHFPGAALIAARWARAAGVPVCLDANRPRPHHARLLPWVDVLIVSPGFPTRYTGCFDLRRAMERLSALGPGTVVATLGEEGCVVLRGEEWMRAPGFPVEVADTTGAGDAFHGAFLFGLLQEWPLERTAIFANAVAALNCTALGGRAGLPTLPQVRAFLARQGSEKHK